MLPAFIPLLGRTVRYHPQLLQPIQRIGHPVLPPPAVSPPSMMTLLLLLLLVEAAPPPGHAAEYAPHQSTCSSLSTIVALVLVSAAVLGEGNVVPPGISRLEEGAQVVDDGGGVAEVRVVVRLPGGRRTASCRPLRLTMRIFPASQAEEGAAFTGHLAHRLFVPCTSCFRNRYQRGAHRDLIRMLLQRWTWIPSAALNVFLVLIHTRPLKRIRLFLMRRQKLAVVLIVVVVFCFPLIFGRRRRRAGRRYVLARSRGCAGHLDRFVACIMYMQLVLVVVHRVAVAVPKGKGILFDNNTTSHKVQLRFDSLSQEKMSTQDVLECV